MLSRTVALVVAVFLTSCARQHSSALPSAPDIVERDDSPGEAAEYFRERRVPGNAPLPIERYTAARRHVSTMRASASLGTWESLGPGNIGGRTRGLVIHPANSSIMWIGGATGGVWKTTDGGQSWIPSTDFAPVLTINSLVIDPRNPDTLYAGTGE